MKINFNTMSKNEIIDWVIRKFEEITPLEPDQRAKKTIEIMNTLDDKLDPEIVEFVMQTRGLGCYEKHKQGMLGDVPHTVKNINDLVEYLDKRWKTFPDGIIDGLKRDGNVLTTRISKCPCEHVNQTKNLVPKSYCNCSAGFYKAMFKNFLGKTVKTEVTSSIVTGGDECEIKIILPEKILEEFHK